MQLKIQTENRLSVVSALYTANQYCDKVSPWQHFYTGDSPENTNIVIWHKGGFNVIVSDRIH